MVGVYILISYIMEFSQYLLFIKNTCLQCFPIKLIYPISISNQKNHADIKNRPNDGMLAQDLGYPPLQTQCD